MININEKKDCCGCSSCAQICPKKCIIMQEDEEGFLYPSLDHNKCVDCGICEKVCPILNPSIKKDLINAYAAINDKDEVRYTSSSGGLFIPIAEEIIKKGGVVFGASFNKAWEVVISYTETIEGLDAFKGSKYLQAKVENAYKECENFLKAGRKVLFTGTPCQIAGLNRFLRKDYASLYTIACVCHGAPSPGVWKKYLGEISKGRIPIKVKFRDKSTGWFGYSFSIEYSNGNIYKKQACDEPYMQAFFHSLIERPYCSKCSFRLGYSNADLMLGDLWRIEKLVPDFNDNLGTSIVIIYNKRGEDLFNAIKKIYKNINLEEAIPYNSGLGIPSKQHKNRMIFFRNWKQSENISKLFFDLLKLNTFEKMVLIFRKLANKTIIKIKK